MLVVSGEIRLPNTILPWELDLVAAALVRRVKTTSGPKIEELSGEACHAKG